MVEEKLEMENSNLMSKEKTKFEFDSEQHGT